MDPWIEETLRYDTSTQMLARHLLEARIVLAELRRRVRHVEVDLDSAVRVHSINVRGYASLPIRVEAR